MSRLEWPGKLAVLVAPDKVPEATAALVQIIRMLDDVPDRCFASRSALQAVAAWKRRTVVPGMADIRAALQQWMRENPDRSDSSLPSDWQTFEHRWLEYWYKRAGEGFCDIGGPHQDRRENLLDLIRTQSPRVAAYIERDELRSTPGEAA